MRTRSLVQPVVEPTLVRYKVARSTGATVGTYYSDFTAENKSTMHDVVTENFHKLRARGLIFNNLMDRVTVEVEHTPATLSEVQDKTYIYRGAYWYASWVEGKVLSPDLSSLSNLKSQALTKAWANLSVSKASSIVTLAEGKKTIDGVLDILKRLYRINKALRKGNIAYLRKQMKVNELLDRWLEWRYGLRPLIGDMNSIIDAFNHQHKVVGSRQTFRGFKPLESVVTGSEPDGFSSLVRYDINKRTTVVGDVRAGVLAELVRLSSPDVWGMYDIPEALYDLTPYSFVVDWIFNVGDTIASWTPSASYSALASWVATRYVVTQECWRGAETYRGTGVTGDIIGGYYKKTTTYQTRVPDPTRSILPVFSVNLDVSKLIDTVALSRQFWRGIPRVRI